MPDKIIQIRNVHKWFGRTHALDGVSLEIEEGEVVVIIGPSGSGKSTLLRSINHLEAVNSGEIIVDGIPLTGKSTDINAVRAEVGMVFQQFNLFPHLTALQNITLAQRVVRKRDTAEAEKKRATCWTGSASRRKRTHFPASFPAGSSSAWPSPAPWRWIPRSCSSTSRPARSTRR